MKSQEVQFQGTIGVSYSHGHSVTCPNCEERVEVREKHAARIKDQICCPHCDTRYKIVVPEDPDRKMTDEEFARQTMEERRVLAKVYHAAHPEVIPTRKFKT